MAESSERFTDNGDGTLTDTRYKMMWMKQDFYQIRGKWITWNSANKFVAMLNEKKYAGYEDWRLPTNQDCRNLYDHDCKNTDFNGDIVHIDYAFPEGCGFNYWCGEENGINAMAYNFYSDRGYWVRQSSAEESFMTCRAVRPAGAVQVMHRVSNTGRSRRE
jgi:hypothetical protein